MLRFSHNGVGIAYVDVPPHHGGEGPPVLLIHGFASDHAVNWVGPQWVKSLTHAGYRVIAFDNRGHGQSDKLYEPDDYTSQAMASDGIALLDHLGIAQAGVIGYSMGARNAAFLARANPRRVVCLSLGGLGYRLVDGIGLPPSIADALEAPSLADVTDPMGRTFRAFADQNRQDLRALAACIRGSRQTMPLDNVRLMTTPTIICVGTNDPIANGGEKLAGVMPDATYFAIEGRDHNTAVGDKTHRAAVVEYFNKHLM